jgi:hypothetical protein
MQPAAQDWNDARCVIGPRAESDPGRALRHDGARARSGPRCSTRRAITTQTEADFPTGGAAVLRSGIRFMHYTTHALGLRHRFKNSVAGLENICASLRARSTVICRVPLSTLLM